VSSVDALKRALIAAKSIIYTQEGASGMYFAGLIERLGIADEVKAKARTVPGGLVAEHGDAAHRPQRRRGRRGPPRRRRGAR